MHKKIKALLALYGLNLADLAKKLGLTHQAVSNKSRRDSYKATELVKLADLTGTRLAFIDENNKPVIVFETEDIK